METKQVVVNKLLTTYSVLGSGSTKIILLHGWGDSSKTFSKLLGGMSIKGCQFFVPDLPGFGKTENPREAWGLSNYAEFVGKFINKLDLKVYCVIGHSNGGAIAIRALSDNCIQAEKLILIASSGVRGEYKGRKKLMRLIAKTGKVVTYPLPKTTKKKIRSRAYKTIGSDMLVAEHLQDTFKKVVSDDVRQDASRLKIDTLLIYGNEDCATPPSYGQKLSANIKNSKLELIDGAGHFVHQEYADHVADLVVRFLT